MGLTDDIKHQGQQLSKTVDDLIDKAKDKLADGLPENVKDKAEKVIDKAVDALPDNLNEKIENLADKAKELLGGFGSKATKDGSASTDGVSVSASDTPDGSDQPVAGA